MPLRYFPLSPAIKSHSAYIKQLALPYVRHGGGMAEPTVNSGIMAAENNGNREHQVEHS